MNFAKPMTAPQYRAALKRLGFDANPEGLAVEHSGAAGISAAGRFFGASPSTGRAWARLGPPASVAVTLRLMIAANISAAKARKLLGE